MTDAECFYRWLKEQGAYFDFVKYAKPSPRWLRVEDNPITKNFVGEAFSWCETDKGSTYWERLSCLWINYIDINKLKEKYLLQDELDWMINENN